MKIRVEVSDEDLGRALTQKVLDMLQNVPGAHHAFPYPLDLRTCGSLVGLSWQLSTPILAIVIAWLAYLGEWAAAAIANLIGGTIFFWVDRWIFRPSRPSRPSKYDYVGHQ